MNEINELLIKELGVNYGEEFDLYHKNTSYIGTYIIYIDDLIVAKKSDYATKSKFELLNVIQYNNYTIERRDNYKNINTREALLRLNKNYNLYLKYDNKYIKCQLDDTDELGKISLINETIFTNGYDTDSIFVVEAYKYDFYVMDD